MKHNWEYKTIRSMCDNTPYRGVISSHDGKYWLLNLDKIASGEGKVTEFEYFQDSDILKGSVTTFGKNYVLYSKLRPNLNKVVVAKDSGFCTTELIPLCPNKNLNSYFLAYFLRSPIFLSYITGKVGGAKMPRAKMNEFWSYSIPVPPISVQERIVAELDEINGMIEAKREQLKQLDLLAQSIFYTMFGDPVSNPKGWDAVKLKDVAKVKIGPFGSLLHKDDYISNGTPLVNPIHMRKGKIFADNNFTVDGNKLIELQNYKLSTGDIVFGRRGDIGRCALVTSSENEFLCGTGSLFVRFSHQINPIFAINYFMQKSIGGYLIEKASGATMLNINCGIVEELPLFLPPLALQQQYANKVEAIESRKADIETTIKELQTLLDSRMDYWFN